MHIQLTNKTIVVTGAGSGIGRAIALECAASGASVVLADLQAAGLEETRRLILESGVQGVVDPLPMRTDVRDYRDVQRLFERACAQFGSLHGVVANAGIGKPVTPSTEISLEDWNSIISVNLTGTFLTLTEAARVLIRQGQGGSLIATGSSTAVRVAAGLLPYVASKAGVHGMVQALAVELGPHRIRVNTLVPGLTATPLTVALPGYIEAAQKLLPMGEIAQAVEHARLVVLALSDAVPHMTGSLLKIDAGRTIA